MLLQTVTSPRNSYNESLPPEKLTGFVSEELLVSVFETAACRTNNDNDRGILKEFNAANGIADLITFELSHDWKNQLAIGHIPPRWAYALYSLPYQKHFTVAEFATLTGTTSRRALSALKQYAELGFCKEGKQYDGWIKLRQPKAVANRIYAVEAKLRNWKRALWQAYRYLDFAAQSWVVLDEATAKPAITNVEAFKYLNVGLATTSTKGEVRSIYTPMSRPPKSTLRFWHANAEIAHRLQSAF